MQDKVEKILKEVESFTTDSLDELEASNTASDDPNLQFLLSLSANKSGPCSSRKQ